MIGFSVVEINQITVPGNPIHLMGERAGQGLFFARKKCIAAKAGLSHP